MCAVTIETVLSRSGMTSSAMRIATPSTGIPSSAYTGAMRNSEPLGTGGMGAVYLAQHQQGYVTANAIRHVADVLGITRADVEDVVSFYTMFYTRPVGRFVLQVCRTLSCALNGAGRVTEALTETLGIRPGETDASGTFTLIEVECLGACDRAPVVMVNDAWHECLQPGDATKLVVDLRARGEAALSGCHLVVEKR